MKQKFFLSLGFVFVITVLMSLNPAKAAMSDYRYYANPSGQWSSCTGTIIRWKVTPATSAEYATAELQKCDGSAFSKSGTATVVLKDTGAVMAQKSYALGVTSVTLTFDPYGDFDVSIRETYEIIIYPLNDVSKTTGPIDVWPMFATSLEAKQGGSRWTAVSVCYNVNGPCGSGYYKQYLPDDGSGAWWFYTEKKTGCTISLTDNNSTYDASYSSYDSTRWRVSIPIMGMDVIANYSCSTAVPPTITPTPIPGGQFGNLGGQIRDGSNGTGIASALVSLGSYSTYANASGIYQFLNIPAGNYNFTVIKNGYVTHQSIAKILANTSNVKNVALTATSGNVNLPVRYVDQVYVQQTWECSSSGCYWNHCGPSSVAMILHYEGIETRDVLNNRQATLDLVCEVKGSSCRGASYENLLRGAFTSRNLQAHTDWTPTMAEIRQSIDNGHPVLLSLTTPGHIVAITGYQGSDNVVINDPYGGLNWWTSAYPYPANRNLPPTTQPRLTGQGMVYNYASLNKFYAIFVANSVSASPSGSLTLSTAGGMLDDNGITVEFSPQLPAIQQPQADSIVTYTANLSPTYSVSGFEAAVTSFRLTATGTNGQPITQAGAFYTLTINVNTVLFDNWRAVNGFTEGEGDAFNPIIPIKFVLAGWDTQLQHWAIIPSVFDRDNSQLVARYDRFTEFAVLVQRQHGVYLPAIYK